MRGQEKRQNALFSYVNLEECVTREHPLRKMRALLLQILFTVRSERQLMEQLDYNLLYLWFIDLGVDAPVWDRTVFSINRDRLLGSDLVRDPASGQRLFRTGD